MLARRIIPCLDVRDGRVVKGTRFADIKDVEDPKVLGKRYSDQGADELVFYDITASAEARAISLSFVADVAKELNIPFCVGGGIRTIEDMTTVLRHGADKVSINSAAIANPDLIDAGARKFGSQCIVLSMDVKEEGGRYVVYQNGGRVKTNLDAIEWAKEGVRRGAGELVINSMNHDGMKQGFDIPLLKRITAEVSVPVIASGGAGTIEHFRELALATDVDGYLAASVFHFGEIAISDLKQSLAASGVPIRLTR